MLRRLLWRRFDQASRWNPSWRVYKPDSLRELLVLLGAQTCSDVIALWGSSQELLAELARARGPLPVDQEFGVAAFWTVASGRAHSTRIKLQQLIEDYRRSCTSVAPVPSGTDTTVRPQRVQIRHLTATGHGPAAPPLRTDGPQDPYAHKVCASLDDFLDLQELGVDRVMMQDPVRPVAQRGHHAGCEQAAVTEGWCPHGCAAPLADLCHGERVFGPCAYPAPDERLFSDGGSWRPYTVAPSMFHALQWYRLNFALPFELDHWLLKPYKLLPLGPTVQPKSSNHGRW